ncbi:unnamed protein product [Prunus armeniaca]
MEGDKEERSEERGPDKSFMWPDFGSEPRNLRLALSSDGINPHNCLSNIYSCWPVILVIYNLPLELCMKRKDVNIVNFWP